MSENAIQTDRLHSRSEIDIIRHPAYNSTDSCNSSRFIQTWLSGKRYHQFTCLTLLSHKPYSCHEVRGQSNRGQNLNNDNEEAKSIN